MLTGAVARRIDCSSEYVRFLVRTGRLQATRATGGVRLFSRADVEAYLKGRHSRDLVLGGGAAVEE